MSFPRKTDVDEKGIAIMKLTTITPVSLDGSPLRAPRPGRRPGTAACLADDHGIVSRTSSSTSLSIQIYRPAGRPGYVTGAGD
jgi:hypothetical protein